MDSPITLDLSVTTRISAEEFAAQLDHEQTIRFFIEVLDCHACVEVDEELIAKLWRGIQGCYEDGERPTLEALLAQYPEASKATS